MAKTARQWAETIYHALVAKEVIPDSTNSYSFIAEAEVFIDDAMQQAAEEGVS